MKIRNHDSTIYISHKEENLKENEEEKMKKWNQCFEQILNEWKDGENQDDQEKNYWDKTPNNELINRPTKEEIGKILNSMNNNKTPTGGTELKR